MLQKKELPTTPTKTNASKAPQNTNATKKEYQQQQNNQ